ncbi:DUF2934 domain-containing protein [Shinella granuli]|uniref:DUF2934 domain-containing protein n=1 Tax=Shinella granuli TaxID=323621 RepID=UPI001055DA00|nr:DUF2934 domain-containing protein [Shinella granuli]
MTAIDRQEEIRRRAYWIWEEEGAPAGEDLRHWSMAEAEFEASNEGAGGANVAAETPVVEISTGNEPARKKIKSTEGP